MLHADPFPRSLTSLAKHRITRRRVLFLTLSRFRQLNGLVGVDYTPRHAQARKGCFLTLTARDVYLRLVAYRRSHYDGLDLRTRQVREITA